MRALQCGERVAYLRITHLFPLELDNILADPALALSASIGVHFFHHAFHVSAMQHALSFHAESLDERAIRVNVCSKPELSLRSP